MIRRLIILLLIVGCVFADVISVTGFRNNTSNSKIDWIGESISDNITSDLVKISSLNIVNRKNLKKILQEQKFQHSSGLVDLEKSVELYERGIELKKICEAKLKKVELQIKKIKMENHKIIKEDFK